MCRPLPLVVIIAVLREVPFRQRGKTHERMISGNVLSYAYTAVLIRLLAERRNGSATEDADVGVLLGTAAIGGGAR